MTDLNSLCLGCMNVLPHPKAACPYCGWSRASGQNDADLLPQGTTLKNSSNGNEYLIGKKLGRGGFGVVYIAWDVNNDRRVAVKEYYPDQFVSRSHTRTVVPKNNDRTNELLFQKQKQRFLEEAQKMQLFEYSPNVVNVLDFFDENDTSYIVMEYIEGQTFTQVLDRVPNKRMSYDSVVTNLKPIADILQRIHNTPWQDGSGIVHRDISPENIMYASDGTVKLLDFGAARVSDPGDRPTGIIKRGYSPYEQELSVPGPDAQQGTWTDVYAFAATIYRGVTGEVPPNALERSAQDTLVPPSQFGLTPAQEQVLLKGLAVKRYDRYQTIDEFYGDLHKLIGQNNGGGQVNVNPGGTTILEHNKTAPMLTVGQFNKNGNTYTAQINYNGDGSLSTSLGFINGNVLSVTNPDGNFNGFVTASEGTNFLPAQVNFVGPGEVKTPVNPLWQKIAWAVAAVTVIAALLFFNRLSSAQEELDGVQLLIQSNENQLERYQSFAADYGYASENYYADKPIVFLNKNSSTVVTITCTLLKKEDDHTVLSVIDGNDVVDANWDQPFDKEKKSHVIIKSGDTAGFATIRFTNEVNSDSFDVLAVVQ